MGDRIATGIGAFESRPVCDGAEPGPAASAPQGWPLFDLAGLGGLLHLRAGKVSGQRSGLEAHGARPVRAARGGLHGGGEAGCERSGAAAAARWPLRWSVLAKAAPSEAARSWRGKRRGAADLGRAVRVDGYGYTLASRPAPLSRQPALAQLSFTRAL